MNREIHLQSALFKKISALKGLKFRMPYYLLSGEALEFKSLALIKKNPMVVKQPSPGGSSENLSSRCLQDLLQKQTGCR